MITSLAEIGCFQSELTVFPFLTKSESNRTITMAKQKQDESESEIIQLMKQEIKEREKTIMEQNQKMEKYQKQIEKLKYEVIMMQKTKFQNDEIKRIADKDFKLLQTKCEILGITLRKFVDFEWKTPTEIVLKSKGKF